MATTRKKPSSSTKLAGSPRRSARTNATGRQVTPGHPDTSAGAGYLQRILNAKVYDVAIESALDEARSLSLRVNNQVLLKREDTQAVFSFKLRGAYNKMARLDAKALARGVICASAGNHAQGVALSARKLGTKATIVMPTTTPQLKIDAVRSHGGEVVLFGESFTDAYAHARALEAKKKLTFVHPFDDPDVIAGQGTVAMEILRQHQGPIDAIFVSIGGGGLISGVAAYVKAVRPEIKVIGVQTEDSDAMVQSVRKGERVFMNDVGLFADGTAVKQVGEETFRLTRALVDDYVVVDTDAVCAAIKDVFQDTRSILEPSGALGVAGVKKYIAQHKLKGKTFVTITSGANMNFDRLRFVAERAEFGEQREALFAVTIPEERGSFRRFCELIGSDQQARQVTEFNYRIADSALAHVFVGVSIAQRSDAERMARLWRKQGFDTVNLSDDELAKEHVRHMVGGRTDLARNERLFRFLFPERPGALMRFLAAMQPDWNISLFHYRNQGADYGRILVGLQVPETDHQALDGFLASLAYPYIDETHNPVYRLFLR